MGKQRISAVEQAQLASNPASPTSGFSVLFPKTDGKWYIKNSDGTVINFSDDIPVDILAAAAMGSPFKSTPIGFTYQNITLAFALTSQRVYFQAVWLPLAATITGTYWYQSVAGSYTSNNYNGVGLYSFSGGTLTLVASSTDDGNIWKATANTWANKPFSSTYPAAAGLYYIGYTYSSSAQTTAPSLGGAAGTLNAAVNGISSANSVKLYGIISGLTALPSPSQVMSGVSSSGNTQPYFTLY